MKTFYSFSGKHTRDRSAYDFPVKGAWLELPREKTTRWLLAGYILPLGERSPSPRNP